MQAQPPRLSTRLPLRNRQGHHPDKARCAINTGKQSPGRSSIDAEIGDCSGSSIFTIQDPESPILEALGLTGSLVGRIITALFRKEHRNYE